MLLISLSLSSVPAVAPSHISLNVSLSLFLYFLLLLIRLLLLLFLLPLFLSRSFSLYSYPAVFFFRLRKCWLVIDEKKRGQESLATSVSVEMFTRQQFLDFLVLFLSTLSHLSKMRLNEFRKFFSSSSSLLKKSRNRYLFFFLVINRFKVRGSKQVYLDYVLKFKVSIDVMKGGREREEGNMR